MTDSLNGAKNGPTDCCPIIGLKDRGMLEDTSLVVWGGEFGRTSMRENRSGQVLKFVGRDHHPSAFTIWMAGGGVKPGMTFGQTDDMGYEIVQDPVEVRDLHEQCSISWGSIPPTELSVPGPRSKAYRANPLELSAISHDRFPRDLAHGSFTNP